MTTPTPTGAPVNILGVDDESNIRKTLAICLEAEVHHVTAVSDYQDAVAEASRRTFHMEFVDLRLGTASGLALIPLLLPGSRREHGAPGRMRSSLNRSVFRQGSPEKKILLALPGVIYMLYEGQGDQVTLTHNRKGDHR